MISTTNMKDVSQIFETYRKNYKKVNPDDDLEEILKRRLPKVCVNNTLTEIITLVNDVLKVHINKEDSISIEDLHALTYCGAQTVIKLCKKNNIAVYDQSEIPNKFPEEENDQKKLYKISPQRFIRLLFNKEMKEVPSEDIRNFYSELWNTQREFNKEEADFYMQQEQLRIAERIECKQDFQKVTESQLRKILKKKKNWAPAGVDGIQYFWYKKLKPIREILLNKINKIITREEEMPDFFTVGLTEFFTKEENPKGPSEYRPITHLPAVYKIITRCVYEKVLEHYQKYGILADEQCGGRKDCYGVRKALVVDSIAQSQNELYGYYIDFKKKFDTLSHKWVIKMLQTYKVDKTLVSFLENTMTKWRTRFYFMPDFLTDSIILKRGVFHGDCISVLLFWTAINPLSFVLNTGRGLTLKNGGVFSHIVSDSAKARI